MDWVVIGVVVAVIGVIATIVVPILLTKRSRRDVQRVEVVKLPEPDARPAERRVAESAPAPAESGAYLPLSGIEPIALPREANATGTYEQWVGEMRMANRDGQLVGVVVNFGHPAGRFDSVEKFSFLQVLPKYLDVRGSERPMVDEDYVQFEFVPAQDGRRIWLRALREGVLAIEVWRSWPQVPWDWLLAEAYSSLLCLRDERITRLFQTNGVAQANLTLGNLVGRGGTTTDVGVTTRGIRLDLMAPEHEVLGVRPRNPSVQHECGITANTDPWGCAKAFVKRSLTKTAVLLFEGRFDAVQKDNFLNMYFETPGDFRRPQGTGA